ncbi:MAG TPA: hypothetical protein VFV41_03165 [Streptosporangiaceae bacterium]|nr:hypothetical protein [Streptosporangiaceae bacterium]
MKYRNFVFAGAAVAVVLGSGSAALALTGNVSSDGAAGTAAARAASAAASAGSAAAPARIVGCAVGSRRTLEHVYTHVANFKGCPKGSFRVGPWNVTGPAGPAGQTGPAGPAGPQGPAGASSVTSITATTNVTDWPESSGWATDAFARQLTVTVQHAAPSAKCGGTPVCYFVTGQLADTGSFETAPGAQSPNGSSSAKISGVMDGTITGVANFEFYASSNQISASNVPTSATGAARPASTSGWGELAFPAGTTFTGVSLPAYSWTYVAPSTCEKWVDQINPGDDGQGPADGNITGVNACTG